MTNAWDKAQTLADKHGNQGGLFVKMANDGDSVIGAFCGDPCAREVVWTGERYADYDPDDPSHASLRATSRFSMNFFVPAEAAMRVIEGSRAWFTDVLKVRKKYGLNKRTFEIERHGAAGDPKTSYSILPEAEIDKELAATIAAAELHDLDAVLSGGGGGSSKSETTKPKKTGPIDPRAAGEIVAKLKSLPRSTVDEFLAKFGVQRVRDLQAADEEAARAWLDKSGGDESEGDIDPFA